MQPFRRTETILNDMISEPPVINYDQVTATFYIWGHGDWNVSLGSLESFPEEQRGGIGKIGIDVIIMNPPGTIGGNLPKGTGWGGLDIFDSLTIISYSSNKSASCHGAEISKNPGRYILFKNTGHKNCFEVEKDGCKNSKIQLQSNYSDLIYTNMITADSTNIEPKNQHDLADYHTLQKMMSWGLHDPKFSIMDATSQSSDFFVRTHTAHNNV